MTTTHVPHQRQSGRLAADVGAAIIELVVYAGILAIGSCISVFLGFLSAAFLAYLAAAAQELERTFGRG